MNLHMLCFLMLNLLFAVPLTANNTAPPHLMLATVYDTSVDVSEYWISEKLDGVRGRWDGKTLWSRGGLAINPPNWFIANWPKVPMDGELWIGRGRFDEISSIVRTMNPDNDAWRTVKFMVFDLPADAGTFEARVMHMRTLLAEADVSWLQPINQFELKDTAELDSRLAEIISAGGEGLMLHHRNAIYRVGRSNDLLKYKPFDDAEARVIGHTSGRGKYDGMLGALIVERPDGIRFRLGTGFSDVQRSSPPPVGSWVTYRYNG